MADQPSCNCPEIDEQDWHLKDTDWSGKIFYFEDVPHILGTPLGLEKKQDAMKADIQQKGYEMINPELILHQPGLFGGRIFVEVQDPEQYDANVIQFENARVLTRAYKGPASGVKQAIAELKAFCEDRTHLPPGAIYLWHVTCSKCASQRGGTIKVLFGRV
jgi:hypothetical protein